MSKKLSFVTEYKWRLRPGTTSIQFLTKSFFGCRIRQIPLPELSIDIEFLVWDDIIYSI